MMVSCAIEASMILTEKAWASGAYASIKQGDLGHDTNPDFPITCLLLRKRHCAAISTCLWDVFAVNSWTNEVDVTFAEDIALIHATNLDIINMMFRLVRFLQDTHNREERTQRVFVQKTM